MNTCTLTLRCTLRSVVQQPQRTAYGLLCFSAKPVNPISHHSYSSILSKASTIRTPNVAVLKRNYASAPLTAQLQKTDREQTGNAGATSDSHTDKDQVPAYDLTFTCKKCLSRSTHRVSKQGFYKGTVLITCPGCKNRHLISDHLKIFSDKPVTIEDLMREKGQLVKRGSLNSDGDVEFWDNESIETSGVKDKPSA